MRLSAGAGFLKADGVPADAREVRATDLAVTYLEKAVRFRWAVISIWLCVVGALSAIWPGQGDWGFFREGSRALIGQPAPGAAGGIHLYASQPEIQVGPPALLAALPFNLLPEPWDVGTARLVMSLSVLVALWLVDRLGRAMGVTEARRQRGVLLGGLMLIPAWVTVAVDFAHLDDILALLLGVLAMLLLVMERPMWAATALGIAVATKPWAIVMVPLLLRSGWRPALRPVALAGVVAVAWWIPFLLDPGTLTSLWSFRLPIHASSGLAALGIDPRGEMPGWVRPAQMLGGVLLGVVAARRGHWTGVLLVGMATRVALDPNPMFYYAVGPVLGALVWDLTRTTTGIPWTAGCAMAAFSLTPFTSTSQAQGVLRLVVCAGLVLAVLLRRAAPSTKPRPAEPRPVPLQVPA